MIGDTEAHIETQVVNCDLPLLLSKNSMQKARTKIDFQKNKAIMFEKEIDLRFTTSGHYYIPLKSENSNETLLSLSETSDLKYKKKVAYKLHKQFSHPKAHKLQKLLQDAGIFDKELLNEIEAIEGECTICQKYKKPPPKPIVAFAFAKDFNESVAMDIKFYSGKPILHLIDHATRFSAASVIHSKERDVVISKIFEIWISMFGSPGQILTDNGGEFNNEDFRIMGEKLNTKIKSTAAESPWSNGINERHNAILGDMIDRIIADRRCSLQVAVASAVSSKNALANVYGFSPNQLVFGKNPNFPSNLINKFPALETPCQSEVVRQKLSAIHSARKAYIEAESSEEISRALKHQTRSSTPHIFQNGDSVYYKRDSSKQWKGPGTVIGIENQTIIIKHGSVYVRVHPCRVMHENSEFKTKQIKDQKDNSQKRAVCTDLTMHESLDSDSEEDSQQKDSLDEMDEQIHMDNHVTTIGELDTNGSEIMGQEAIPEENMSGMNNQDNTEDSQNTNIRQHVFSPVLLPRLKSTVQYKPKGETSWKTVTILGRGGKATEKYKNFLNVMDTQTKEQDCIDWKNDMLKSGFQ